MVESVNDDVLGLRLRQQEAVAWLSQRALRTPDLDAFLDDATRLIAEHFDVEHVAILERLPGGQDMLLRAGRGWRAGAVGEVMVPGGLGSQPGYTLVAGRPVVVEDVGADSRFQPTPIQREHGVAAIVSVPIYGPRKPYGVVTAGTRHRRTFTQDDATMLQSVANVLGAAIQLHLNARAERLLAEAGELLNGSLDYEQTLASLAQLLVPRLGDWCSVHVVDRDGHVRELEIAHRDPELAAVAHRFLETHRAAPPNERVDAALRTGRPVVFSRVDPERVEREIHDPDQRALLDALGTYSAMLLPMVARGRTLGVMQLVSARPQRRYGYDDVQLGRELASRAGLAVDNARLYRTARETAAMREAFLSSVSHELRTPLTSVLGFAHRLARHAGRFDAETQGDIETLIAEAQRLHTSLDTLLNLAELESGHVRLSSEPLELRRLVEEEIAAMLRRYPAVRVAPDFPSAPCIVFGDPGRVRQVIANLLDNAAKYGGHPAEITVSIRSEERRTTISVRDHGPGIPAELRPHVFKQFVRGDRARAAGGMGLGLYLSRLIAERLHADLSLGDPEGGGAEILLRLPPAPAFDDQE